MHAAARKGAASSLYRRRQRRCKSSVTSRRCRRAVAGLARRTAARSPWCRPWARSTPATWRWSPRRGGAPTMSSPRSSSIRPSSAPNEDLATYPRREADGRGDARGRRAARSSGRPTSRPCIPTGFATTVRVGGVSEGLDGAARPGHFDGVATVVAQAVRPGPARHRPVRREGLSAARRHPADGPRPRPRRRDRRRADPARRRRPRSLLAQRLSVRRGAAGRARAAAGARRGGGGDRSAAATSPRRWRRRASGSPSAGFDPIDYVELRDAETLAPVTALDRPARLLAAARIGRTRLIDNLPVEPPDLNIGDRGVNHLLMIDARKQVPDTQIQRGMSNGEQSEIRDFPDRKPDRRRGHGRSSTRSTSSASLIRPAPAASRSTSSKPINGSTSPR